MPECWWAGGSGRVEKNGSLPSLAVLWVVSWVVSNLIRKVFAPMEVLYEMLKTKINSYDFSFNKILSKKTLQF